MWMRRIRTALGVVIVALTLVVAAGWAAETARRPKIYGISSVRISCDEPCVATGFYSKLFPLSGDCWDCGNPPETPFGVNDSQGISLRRTRSRFGGRLVSPNPSSNSGHLYEIAFDTDDEKLLQKYLAERGVKTSFEPPEYTLTVTDPEGHRIRFFQHSKKSLRYSHATNGMRLIHVGFVVKDRAAMDHFYKDILGFHVYWSGGMKDGETDWVDMQVPDGTDWVEYMLNVPDNADKRTLEVMNHIALGVPDVHSAARELEKNGVKLTEEPKIGRDGKWQLNLYDPDGTRVELMEFTPTGKPCCSEYTGPHPKP